MKKSHLKNIIKETILEEKGYSNFVPGKQTSGLDKKTLDSILLRIAKNERPSDEEHSAARGNRILDKANPENVKRILQGDEPIYEDNIDESFESLVNKLVKQGKSKEDAEKIAGSINAKYVHHYREGVERMQELAGIKNEIKVNNQISQKLTKGDQVRFQNWKGKDTILYFEKPFNEKQGFFKDEQQGGLYRKDYKNIISINGKKLNEIRVNKPKRIWDFTKYISNFNPNMVNTGDKIITIGSYKFEVGNIESNTKKNKIFFHDSNSSGGIDFKQMIRWNNKNNPQMKLQEILKEELNNIINQNKREVLTFEENPLEFIIQKYPSLNKTLEDLLTDKYRDYITGIFIVAPKPTIFKIILHNGQFFYLTYAKQGYIAKVSGKQYFLMNLKEEEYAIKGISNLLMMGMPPSSEGPGEETPQDGVDNNFVADMTSEPGGDNLDLDGIDTDGETPPEGEDNTEEEPIKETKEKRYRIISEIKVEKPSKYIIGNRYNVDHDYGDDVIFKGEKFRKGSNWYEFENTEEEVTLWIPKK